MEHARALFVYVTCPDLELARKISQAVVNERLAACTNILPQMESHYRWQGKVETSQEVVLIIKTTPHHYAAIEERVRALHSYDLPCILALPISKGLPEYLTWIEAETSSGSS